MFRVCTWYIHVRTWYIHDVRDGEREGRGKEGGWEGRDGEKFEKEMTIFNYIYMYIYDLYICTYIDI